MFSDEARVMLMAITKLRWPGCKKDVFLFVLANEQTSEKGVECSQWVISEWTGISANVVRKYLLELVDEKLLERHDGGGPRAHAFRSVRDFALWRSRWFGSFPGFDRDWNLKQSAAVAELELLILTLEDRKTGAAARSDSPLGLTATRQSARQRGAKRGQSRALGRATDGPLVPPRRARQESVDHAVDTIPLNSSSNSLTRQPASEAAKQVLGRIRERQRPGTWIPRDRRADLAALIDSIGDAQPFLRVIEPMPEGTHALDMADAVEEIAATHTIPKPPPRTIETWKEGEPAEPPVPPEIQRERLRQLREHLRTRGTAPCETDDGGAT